jgi:hypothetical protein
MGVIIDIVGMLVVRASIIAIVLNLMVNLHEALYKSAERNSMTTTMAAARQTISSDLALAGYNSSTKTFRIARKNDMSFRTDIDNDGDYDIDVDSVRYYVSPNTSGANKVLYRVVNLKSGLTYSSVTMEVARDVDTFYMVYYNASGGTVTYGTGKTVKSIYVNLRIASKNTTLTVQSGKTDSVARKITWEQHFFPDNL